MEAEGILISPPILVSSVCMCTIVRCIVDDGAEAFNLLPRVVTITGKATGGIVEGG